MLRQVSISSPAAAALLVRSTSFEPSVDDAVRPILQDVRDPGDAAVRE